MISTSIFLQLEERLAGVIIFKILNLSKLMKFTVCKRYEGAVSYMYSCQLQKALESSNMLL